MARKAIARTGALRTSKMLPAQHTSSLALNSRHKVKKQRLKTLLKTHIFANILKTNQDGIHARIKHI